jgi:general secretion pathway protein A
MYQTYWQLLHKPFESTADQRFYYPSEGHQVALLKLRYAIENRQGAAMLIGAGGTGKTLLLDLLQKHLSDDCAPFVRLVFPQMPAVDLLTYLADELGAPVVQNPRHTVEESVRRLQRFLAENAENGRHAVVAIDEAHLIEDRRSLEALRLLLNFETESRPQLTFLLVGQPSLISTLQRVPQLEERLAARCLLKPLTQEATLSYVSHRLTAAGGSRPIFDTEGLEALHELSHGNPRKINRLGDLALLVGFADELPAITRGQVEAVSQELSLAAA